MSISKNYYGKNVAWFCIDASITLDDMQEDGMLLSSVEIYRENEAGQEGCTEIEVTKLLESAFVVISEQENNNEKLANASKELIKALRVHHGITLDHIIGANTRKALQQLTDLLDDYGLDKEGQQEWKSGDKAMLDDSEVLVIGYHPEHPLIVIDTGDGLGVTGVCSLKKPNGKV
ncbi:hypothetical protein [Vibrio harveyi]|uniref:hypothetical protein n=1 Tax=Vibrio harveyi TaxID=669 RepID=UPI00237E1D1D|nr:hypothetical protein [Vibrio harveyi]HDM8061682.1 hypothetical protein [Vibrio harveyi]